MINPPGSLAKIITDFHKFYQHYNYTCLAETATLIVLIICLQNKQEFFNHTQKDLYTGNEKPVNINACLS